MKLSNIAVCWILIFLVIIGLLAGFYVFSEYHQDIRHAGVYGAAPVSPSVAWNDVERYLAAQYPEHYMDALKQSLQDTLRNTQGHFSVYLNGLDSGAWLGINENDPYKGWSLLKVSVVMTLLKKVERRQLTLNQNVVLRPHELREKYVLYPVTAIGANGMPMKALVSRMISFSDNTASAVLGEFVQGDEFQECLLATGLPPALPNEPRNNLPCVSPKQFASLLRSLYYSSYLQPPFSRLILALMVNTIYNSQIKTGVPEEIPVAHKVGFNAACGDFHDCGIIYFPHHPYILCVMGTGSTREEADRVISAVSRQVYDFMVCQYSRISME